MHVAIPYSVRKENERKEIAIEREARGAWERKQKRALEVSLSRKTHALAMPE